MEWAFVVLIAVFALGYIFLRWPGWIPVKDAHEYLRRGAIVVDVRTSTEFNARHLSLPVDQIQITLPPRVPDKTKPILLHCQIGPRAAAAKRKLNAIGYVNVHNLGSYSRAERVIRSL